MTLTIELPPEVERYLAREAARRGQTAAEFVRTVLEERFADTRETDALTAEERLYLGNPPEGMPPWIERDVAPAEGAPALSPRSSVGAATLEAPATVRIAMPERRREPYLELRLRDGGELVAVIELLSPTSKRP